MNITDIQNKTAVIHEYQSTFIVLKIEDQLLHFDFIDKQEFKLKKGSSGTFQYLDQHPLLLNYNEGSMQTFINSKPDSIDLFLEEFKITIEQILGGWMTWTNYITDNHINFTVDNFINNVKNGTGQLSRAPNSINEKIIAVCKKHNVDTISFGDELKRYSYNLITIGDNNFVIAKEFRFHAL